MAICKTHDLHSNARRSPKYLCVGFEDVELLTRWIAESLNQGFIVFGCPALNSSFSKSPDADVGFEKAVKMRAIDQIIGA